MAVVAGTSVIELPSARVTMVRRPSLTLRMTELRSLRFISARASARIVARAELAGCPAAARGSAGRGEQGEWQGQRGQARAGPGAVRSERRHDHDITFCNHMATIRNRPVRGCGLVSVPRGGWQTASTLLPSGSRTNAA